MTSPFPEGITRYIGNNNLELGRSYWFNKSTPDAPMLEQNFAIDDSVGPLLATATLIERMEVGNDSLIITFTEGVSLEVITGQGLELIKPGSAAIPLNILSAGYGGPPWR